MAATFQVFLYWVCLIFPLHVFQPLKTAVILREILNISRSVSPNCISIYTITYACRCDVKIAQAFIRLLIYYITFGKITNGCVDLHCSTKCKIAINWPISQSANHNEIIFSVIKGFIIADTISSFPAIDPKHVSLQMWQCRIKKNWIELNRPFPSSLVPLFQNESKCETIHMKMSSAFSFVLMQIKVIFVRMVSHLDSLWNRGTRELGNGLLVICL